MMSNPTAEKKTVIICDVGIDLLQLFGQTLRSKYDIILVSSGEDCIDRFIEELGKQNTSHTIRL
jgi:hypothetical protein